MAEADDLRRADPADYLKRARDTMGRHVTAMLALLDRGAEVFDYGNSLRAEARLAGVDRAFDYPGFVPAYIRPLFCEGKGPFRWVALSGDPADIGATDRAVLEEFPDNEPLARWIRMASDRVAFQGLPARICWLGLGERARMGARFNDMVASGQLAGARSSSAATTSIADRSPRPTGRPRPWPTAPTPSPTGRCSTPWSTWPRARRGSAFTTAAGWASADPCTPARCASPTARRSPPPSSNGSSPTTRPWA